MKKFSLLGIFALTFDENWNGGNKKIERRTL
jgi:hypothetical protein